MSIAQPPKDYQTLFLDMNSFFASVEQQVQPTLRGKPVGVAPYTGGSGCIIAASLEAKQMGIKIGRVSEAKNLCPNLVIVESRPALYMVYHKEIKKVIESFTPYFKPLSIDEFLIHLTPRDQNETNSIKLALALKRAIKNKVGDYLKCSIGISTSYFLAKMAGERKKPDGLTLLRLGELEKFYGALTLRDLVGINWRMERYLKSIGIKTPLDLYRKSLPELRQALNHWGRLWYFRLRGYEVDEYESKTKTIGHSHVLAPEYRTREGALSVIEKLIHKAGYRLRKEGYWAKGVAVSIRFVDRGGFAQSRSVNAFCDSKSFHDHIFTLLKECRWQSRPIYVSISSFHLVRMRGEQISFLPEIEKARQIARTIDQINDHFGADTVYPASMHLGFDSAPDRIPFGRPRYDIRHE